MEGESEEEESDSDVLSQQSNAVNLKPRSEFDSRLPRTHRYLEGPRKTLVDVISGFFIAEASQYSDHIKEQASAIVEFRQWFHYLAKDSDYVRSCADLKALPINWKMAVKKEPLKHLDTEDYDNFSSIVLGIEKMKVGGTLAKELIGAVNAAAALAWACSDMEDSLADVWSDLPSYAHPREGQVPESRLKRKCQQLGSIVSAVLSIAQPGDTLVDFCCGGGHVGILLAHFLPSCRVILLENKEESLVRAEERIASAGDCLSNVFLYKCNLTDFRSKKFQVGIALHACGTATDLVMDACIAADASFVISPCCYGAIKPNGLAGRFPRSSAFRQHLGGLDRAQRVFARLSHSADITDREHAMWATARQAMRLVDSDRLRRAEESGCFGELRLQRMTPEGCSPKDHLLIGRRRPV